jgi:dolichyl-phosphate-mannose--protein O-mannosyl transferase
LVARDRVTCLLLFLGAFLLFLPWSGFPTEYNFDEVHYIVAAKLLVPPVANLNWEHPPLAKYWMGLGIALAGDRPLGWRLAAMVFGGISIAGMYAWGLATFRERGLALWMALATLLNMVVFVLARTAMLDIFLLAFLVWGIAAFTAAWDPGRPTRQVRILLGISGGMLGLATACKWVGVVVIVFVLLLYLTLRLLQRYGRGLFRASPGATREPWYSDDLWRGISWMQAALLLGAFPVAVYALSYLPFLRMPSVEGTISDILRLQKDMAYAQTHIGGMHHYASEWYQWPFDWKPIWYYFHSAAGWTRGILLIGNPLILFGGFAAVLFCTWVWWKERSREAFLSVVWYWLLWLCFAAIPRKISFFHYYLPAACALSLPLAYIFRHYGGAPVFRRAWGRWAFLALAAAIFILFYPVLVGLPLPSDFSPQ